jgi:hypothetical protein
VSSASSTLYNLHETLGDLGAEKFDLAGKLRVQLGSERVISYFNDSAKYRGRRNQPDFTMDSRFGTYLPRQGKRY